jgi:hypothetical protein
VQRFADWSEKYAAEHIRRTDELPGLAIWEGDSTPIDRVSERKLALILLRRAEFRTVQNQGIEIFGRFYKAAFLNKHVDERVELGWTDNDLSRIAVFRLGSPRRDGAAVEDAQGFLGWAYLAEALPKRHFMGLVASRAKQERIVATAESTAEEMRIASRDEHADPSVLEFELPKESRRRDPLRTRRQKRHVPGTMRVIDEGPDAA